jgi:cell division protein FtsI (penicillin-binding protein 3)
VLTLFAGRLVQIQGMEAAYWRNEAVQEKLKPILLPAQRGTIYGANGQILAMTIETYTITADPPHIPAADKPVVAQQLAGPLALPAARILYLLEHPSSPEYVVLAKDVSATSDAAIEANKFFNAGIYDNADKPSYTMAYPDGDATANVVGFTHTDGAGAITGQAGIEAEYNKELTGTAGSEQVELGADNQPIPLAGSQDTPARNGESIRLTIIPSLQLQAQQACQQEMEKSRAKQCTVVVIAPKTGDILAMAQYPTYSRTPVTNVADTANLDVQSEFTPGSTAKVITAAAALEHGGQTPMSTYYIPYQIYRGGQAIHDAEWSPREYYTIAGIIANSSNVGMSKVVAHVPPQIQYDYLKAFGLDQPTGLNLPGETPGQLPALSQWAADERYTLSYGQGIAVNAVQMASVYATIANGGVRVAPRLIAGTYNAAGQYTPAPPSKSTRVIRTKTAKELISILQQVPGVDEQASQPWGIIPNYAVASKTGTANEPDPNGKCPAAEPLCVYGASYIGMAPGNGPQVVVAVNVQNPDKSHQNYFGDVVAGPVFYSVMQSAIATLQIQPQPGLVPPHVRLNCPTACSAQ